MAASADQKSSSTSGDDRNLVTIDENYLMFWEKNGRAVIAVVVFAALAIVARWAFGAYAESRERAIAAEYAAAKDSAGLKAFAQAHPEAELAGVAQLRVADEAYAAGNFAAAQADYEAAAKALSGQVLGDRARLGAAISKLQAGDTAGGKAALEALAKDLVFTRTLRAEAAFHLALQARDAGQPAEAKKMIELVLTADATGLWAQRAMQLRSSLPADPAPAAQAPVESAPAATATPAASAPASGESTPSVSFPSTK
jgi:hypothetical protein